MKFKIIILLTFVVQFAGAQDYFEIFKFKQKHSSKISFKNSNEHSENEDYN